MDENQQIMKERFSELPDSLKSYISSRGWSDSISDVVSKFGLSNDNHTTIENEVLMVLLGFSARNKLEEILREKLRLDIHIINQIENDLKENIFKKLENEFNEIEKQITENEKEETTEAPSNNIGQSFEQIILNQAKAMQPARPVDESGGSMNHELRIMNGKEEKPSNLPTTGEAEIHDYKPGTDPYREPIE